MQKQTKSRSPAFRRWVSIATIAVVLISGIVLTTISTYKLATAANAWQPCASYGHCTETELAANQKVLKPMAATILSVTLIFCAALLLRAKRRGAHTGPIFFLRLLTGQHTAEERKQLRFPPPKAGCWCYHTALFSKPGHNNGEPHLPFLSLRLKY